MTPSSSFSVGQAQTQVAQRHLKRQPTSVAQAPLFGSVVVSDGDRVHFGAGRQHAKRADEERLSPIQEGDELQEIDEAPSTPPPTANAKQDASTPKKPAYGAFRNNLYAGLGMVFSDVVPIALSLPMFIGTPGLLLTTACLPMSYLSGKIGRWISRDVDKQNLNSAFKYISEVRSVISDQPQEGAPHPVTRLNQALNDLLNVRGGGMLSGPKGWLLSKLTLSPTSGFGKLIDSFTKRRLAAQVNHRVANADSFGGAAKEAGKGLANYTYYTVLSKLGTALASWNFWPAKAVGFMLQNAALGQFGFDMFNKAPEQPQTV